MDNPECLRIAELIVVFVNIFYFGFVGFHRQVWEGGKKKLGSVLQTKCRPGTIGTKISSLTFQSWTYFVNGSVASQKSVPVIMEFFKGLVASFLN
jgi:hypothetical protein